MSEAERLAEDLHRQFMNDDTNFDTMIEASIELRRLAAVERELEALKASIGEPVAWRYKDSRGHYRYCGYKTGFDTEHSLLKPISLYALTSKGTK